MTIASEDRLKQYIGSGSAGPFPITFTIFNKGDLKVQRTIISTGVSTELTLDAGTDGYTVDTTLENITLTETIDSDERLTIEGSLDFLQPIDYIPNSTFPSEVTEQGFDRLTMLIQQVKSLVDKAFRLPTSSANTPGELPEPVDGKALVWDGTGGDIRNSVINVDDFSTALTDAQTAATEAETAQTAAELAETNAAASAASAAVSAGLLPQNDFAQSGPPDADNDVTEGFSTGSRWFDTVGQEMYTCLDATDGAAIWETSTLSIDDLGNLAVLNTINNDQWSGSDLAIANGGTGASTAGAARTALDVYSKGEVDTAVSGLSQDLLHIQYRLASGTAGGSASATSWNALNLNAILTNEIAGSSQTAGVITLPAGTYYTEAECPFYDVNGNRLRLYDVDNTATLVSGTNQDGISGNNVSGQALLKGRFTLASETDVRFDLYTNTARATDGLGRAVTTGDLEIYTNVLIWSV